MGHPCPEDRERVNWELFDDCVRRGVVSQKTVVSSSKIITLGSITKSGRSFIIKVKESGVKHRALRETDWDRRLLRDHSANFDNLGTVGEIVSQQKDKLASYSVMGELKEAGSQWRWITRIFLSTRWLLSRQDESTVLFRSNGFHTMLVEREQIICYYLSWNETACKNKWVSKIP